MASFINKYTLSCDDHARDFIFTLEDLFQQKEFVDVTLVADGHLFHAHRLVLSAFSPYFRQMLAQVPANQQAFVFLTNVSKNTLEDLLIFIYTGKVDVNHENLDEVLNVAKAFNIKGLCDQSFASFFNSKSPTFNSCEPKADGVQYQSTRTIRVPESTKDQLSSFQQPTNAFDLNLKNGKIKDIHGMNGYGGNGHYDILDNDCFYNDFNDPMAMEQEYAMQDDQWNSNLTHSAKKEQAKPNGLKPAKRLECGVVSMEHNIVADIRSNGRGSENLFHLDHKFNKHNKINKYGKQRWQCTTRVGSHRCRAAATTMEVNGIMMMKVLNGEHSH